MRAYISGPIDTNVSGTTRESRKEMFYECETFLAIKYPHWTPVNPLDVEACPDLRCGGTPDKHTWNCYLKHDLASMLLCDVLVMLPGWPLSKGARLEEEVARSVGMRVFGWNTRALSELD